jgi:RNA polymerase sigma-70 factor (ECF subfamily)
VLGGLEALPERQRRALLMHELEDRSHSQIGRALGVSAGASKALVFRARQGVAQAVGRRAAT